MSSKKYDANIGTIRQMSAIQQAELPPLLFPFIITTCIDTAREASRERIIF